MRENPFSVEGERRLARLPHPLDDGDGVQRILLGIQPAHPDDRSGSSSSNGRSGADGGKDAERVGHVRGGDPIATAGSGHSGS
jgi:hypothetical protein